jgi:hypothetical protein
MSPWGASVERAWGSHADRRAHRSTPESADGNVSSMGTHHPERQRPRSSEAMIHYLVDTPDGPVGVLDGWERDADGHTEKLVGAHGWFGRRRFTVPVEDVLRIDHERRSVLIAGRAAQPD